MNKRECELNKLNSLARVGQVLAGQGRVSHFSKVVLPCTLLHGEVVMNDRVE